jgi:hypothetical protein
MPGAPGADSRQTEKSAHCGSHSHGRPSRTQREGSNMGEFLAKKPTDTRPFSGTQCQRRRLIDCKSQLHTHVLTSHKLFAWLTTRIDCHADLAVHLGSSMAEKSTPSECGLSGKPALSRQVVALGQAGSGKGKSRLSAPIVAQTTPDSAIYVSCSNCAAMSLGEYILRLT